MAFKLNGMNFGAGIPNSKAGMEKSKYSSMSRMMDDLPLQNTPYNFVGPKVGQAEWGENDAGYVTKTRKSRNLLGQERIVTKFYDKETGEKLGKQIQVPRSGGRPDKIKTKRVNRGLTKEGGVGKIRVGADYFSGKGDKDKSKDENKVTKPINRAERAADLKDVNVKKDDTGKPTIPTYSKAFSGMEVNEDGMRVNPRNKSTYTDDAEGQKKFEIEAEDWWDAQATKTSNEGLRKQNQPYGREYGSPNKKRKRYSMKNAPFKNYKKGYYGAK